MSELTRTTTTQSTDASAAVALDGAELGVDAQRTLLLEALALARAAAQLGAGLDSDASAPSCARRSALRRARPTRCSGAAARADDATRAAACKTRAARRPRGSARSRT